MQGAEEEGSPPSNGFSIIKPELQTKLHTKLGYPASSNCDGLDWVPSSVVAQYIYSLCESNRYNPTSSFDVKL